jgi:hypothetical protein
VIIAAGGEGRALVGAGSASVGASASGRAIATRALASAEVEDEAAVAAEAGVGAEAGGNLRSSEANADGPKNANNMTHVMASLTLRLLFLPVANERQGFPLGDDVENLGRFLSANAPGENKVWASDLRD